MTHLVLPHMVKQTSKNSQFVIMIMADMLRGVNKNQFKQQSPKATSTPSLTLREHLHIFEFTEPYSQKRYFLGESVFCVELIL